MADAHSTGPPKTGHAPSAEAQRPTQATPAKLWQVIVIALVAIVFTAVWLGVYNLLAGTIWPSNFTTTRRWTIPVGVLVFSLLVGLAQKYLRAPTVINGGVVNAFKGGEDPDYTSFPGALLSSYASLLSGVSVGPEGSLGVLVQDIAEWTREKLKITRETALGFRIAALASAYNGIIGSALFTGVLATELGTGGNNALAFLAWNLLAGVIGFTFFTLLNLHVFAKYVPFTPISQLTLPYFLYAIVLGVLGALIAIFIALAFRVLGMAIERIFQGRVVLRALAAGLVIAVIVFFVPEVMFAGETQIFPPIQNPASYGVLALVGLGVLKLLLLALSIKSGFLGGPTFPILFSCTMFGLALSLLFPGVPVSIFVLCIEAAAITLALRAPLTAILLVAVVGTADPNEVALLVLSSVVALMVGSGVQRLQARRSANSGRAHSKPMTTTAQ
ncbi:MAG TPA: chloride channel protein [Ktedonobacterales bacterium]|nr:chloride channel protein [Ktedonobacterales bacterium]